MQFQVRSVPQPVADEVRHTRLAPDYGHPAHLELAQGTGPCRCCLRQFVPGQDQRLLFTYRPVSAGLTHGAGTGIHSRRALRGMGGRGISTGSARLATGIRGTRRRSRVIALTMDTQIAPEAQVASLFDAGAEWLALRHAQAGCFIARIDRACRLRPVGDAFRFSCASRKLFWNGAGRFGNGGRRAFFADAEDFFFAFAPVTAGVDALSPPCLRIFLQFLPQ